MWTETVELNSLFLTVTPANVCHRFRLNKLCGEFRYEEEEDDGEEENVMMMNGTIMLELYTP